MIKELYERLNLRYQIFKTGREIRENMREEAWIKEIGFIKAEGYHLVCAENALDSFDHLTSLRERRGNLLFQKLRLETRLSYLKINKK